jgi:protein-tyrosine phosphatase
LNSTRKRALLWLSGLVPFFFLTYNFSNWAASRRYHVPSIVFGWESHIPFLAWTIVPYWTTDFFYILSFYFCKDRREVDAHGKRLLAVQVISVFCFLLFPLQFAYDHPKTTGLSGWLFHALGNFDQPFNQAPSLHLSLTTILWAKYSEHLRGFKLRLLQCWFVLVGISTLTTYQHHFIDLPAGIWVGLFCIVLFPAEKVESPRSMGSTAIAAVYLAGAILLAALGVWAGRLGWLLFWPAGALLIIAGVYWTGSPELFRDNEGVMEPARILLLAPYVAARWLHTRLLGEPGAHEIVNGVWLGRLPRRAERDALRIASVVHLAAELPANRTGIISRGVPMLDLIAPTADQLEAAVRAIDYMNTARPTLVCCALGYSRSAAVMAAWLVASRSAASIDAAISMIQAHRPRVVLTAAHRERLYEWARARTGN